MVAVVNMRCCSALLFVCLWLAGCAPWEPAPVEDRSRVGEDPGVRATSGHHERVSLSPPPNYEVRRGDTLYSIAFRYGLDWREVAGWNRIEAPYMIRPGQELRLTEPPSASKSATVRRETRSSTPASPSPRAPDPEPERAGVEESPEPSSSTEQPPASSASGNSRTVGGVEWQWPASGQVVSPFDASATRRGLGIGGQAGQPVYAAASGKVVYSGTALIGYGELIIIKHSDTLLSAYGHNRVRLVEEGDGVSRGDPIAEMGLNERDEELLHFEIRRNGQPVDPLGYLPSR